MKRQGDLLFVRVDDLPFGRTWPVEDGVIARGEVTGHAHQLVGDGHLLRGSTIGGANLAVVAGEGGAAVTHEEHDRIELEPGVWLIRQQTEYIAPGETAAVYD